MPRPRCIPPRRCILVARFSGWTGGGAMQERSQRLLERQRRSIAAMAGNELARARVVSEAAIAQALVERIDATGRHDSIDIAALYLSQRELVRALLDAAGRGVAIRVLLEP